MEKKNQETSVDVTLNEPFLLRNEASLSLTLNRRRDGIVIAEGVIVMAYRLKG